MTKKAENLNTSPKPSLDIAGVSVCARCENKQRHKDSIYCIDCLYERKMSGY